MLSVNWLALNYDVYDGYGRYSRYLVRALSQIGVKVKPMLTGQVRLSGWLQRLGGMDYSNLTIACMPPYMLRPIAGQQWNLTMTEGTRLPSTWSPIANVRADRIIVPCEHNAEAFADSGVTVPISIVHGGTSPSEFPAMHWQYDGSESYTFLTLADRGARKGWVEVWAAFYQAFGSPSDTPDARLIIKTRNAAEGYDDLMSRIVSGCTDSRIVFWREDVAFMSDVYSSVDCFAIPSRSEGWGMPHREAAMMGLPVIVIRYSGLDDGHTDDWAIVIEKMSRHRIPASFPNCGGYWQKADVTELAEKMRWCYENRTEAAERGRKSAQWLRDNQTWKHSAMALRDLIEEHG